MSGPTPEEILKSYKAVRTRTVALCQPLVVEDYVVQTMEDVSPPKWHLGHTTWFFEQVILVEFVKDYRPLDERYFFIFNSYYESFGERGIAGKEGHLHARRLRKSTTTATVSMSRCRNLSCPAMTAPGAAWWT